MIKFEDLVKKTREVEITYEEETLKVVYRVDSISAQAYLVQGRMYLLSIGRGGDDVQKIMTDIEGLVKFLTNSIVSWDLTMNGEMLPVTQENLAALPMPFLNRVFNEIMEDSRPNAKTAGS